MQKIFIILAIFGLGFASANLRTEMDELIEFLKMEEVREIYNWWIVHDAQVGEIYAFLQTDEANEAWVVITTSNPDMQEISAWALERGVDLKDYLNRIATVLGLSPIGTRALRNTAARSWASMMEEIRAVQDLDGAKARAAEFIDDPTSEFGELHRMIAAQHESIHGTFEDPAVRRVSSQLRAFGVDIDGFIERLYDFFGWDHSDHH
ncbi:protein G12-like [Ochlerotatus camptorhynchus]|uniref:protein G12-like n=1 Tax=Ochlerotatus camptorhynchus TaxID=644619 RepID=UPI0031E183F1